MHAQADAAAYRSRPYLVWRHLPFEFVTSVDLWAGLIEIGSLWTKLTKMPVPQVQREEAAEGAAAALDDWAWTADDYYGLLFRLLGIKHLEANSEQVSVTRAHMQRSGNCAWRSNMHWAGSGRYRKEPQNPHRIFDDGFFFFFV